MKIKFPAFVRQTREVEVSYRDVHALLPIMKDALLFYVRYSNFDIVSSTAAEFEKGVQELCERYDVEYKVKEDRVAFIESLLDLIKNVETA